MNTRYKPKLNCNDDILKRLARAITGKSCPICLCHVSDRRAAVITACMHAYCFECIEKWSRVKRKCPLCNVEFDSWFCKINLSAKIFRKEKLLTFDEGKVVNSFRGVVQRWHRNRLAQERAIRRSRGELCTTSSRTRPLPRRRSFGRPGEVDPDVIAERVRRWRASIYERRMQAVPSAFKNSLVQQIAEHSSAKELVLQRIDPWVRRELHAILGDPDPSVIVHVTTSLFISALEKRHEGSSRQSSQAEFLAPLRRFLHGQTNMFWHELRCFAESSFSMETYDSVVEYKSME